MHSLWRILPEEDLIYFGDTARVPYGGRSRETILKYARQDVRFLRSFDLKAILIACGTVTTTSLATLQAENDLPMVGVVEPTCRRAVLMTQNKRVGHHRHAGLRPLRRLRGGSAAAGPGGDRVQPGLPPVRAPGGERAHPAGRRGDRDRGPGVSGRPCKNAGMDTLILGCTHYPLLTDVIGDVMGPGVDAGVRRGGVRL